MVMSASPLRRGVSSLDMSWPAYWLSASVFTMKSAPRLRLASIPAMNAAARPLWRVNRTTWSTPHARATSWVPSREPSSMTSVSMTSMPRMCRGRSRNVSGSVAASFKHGIWITTFFTVRVSPPHRPT